MAAAQPSRTAARCAKLVWGWANPWSSGFVDQLFFNLILKPQIDDTEAQERAVRDSGVDWVIVQPVHLTDEDSDALPYLSASGQARLMKVARKSVAKFLALAAREPEYIGKSVAISG